MPIQDIFVKDIARPINGVVKAEQQDDDSVWQELDEYVVTRELDQHFRKLLQAYLNAIDNASDPNVATRMGVWISGFFGSGKSHFVKILSYLLENRLAQNPHNGDSRRAIDFFADKIQDPMLLGDFKRVAQDSTDVILFNIDSRADSSEGRAAILLVFWRVFNEMQGLCSQHPHIAELERYLIQKGKYEIFCDSFKKATAGDDWANQRDSYHFHSDEIIKALNDSLGMSEQAADKWLDRAENETVTTVEGFAKAVQEYLDSKGPSNRLIFLVDEMGQFIGEDTHLMLNLQTVVEDLGRLCKGRAWVIVTSQEDIDAVLGGVKGAKANDFSKIQGRFYTRLSLSSSDVAEVIKARLLEKKEIADHKLAAVFKSKGDILKNQLSFTSDSATQKNYLDGEDFAANYPFVPYHFPLVQKIFESIRKAGATGLHLARGERSMLDAFQSAARSVSDQEIGVLVPLYEFFPCIESFLDTAVKLSIDQARDNTGLQQPFDNQLLQTLFLIRYVDSIKPNVENLVTLCIDQVDADRITLKRSIEASLQRLERENLINSNGDLFFFLTNEEREISREIKNVDISAADETRMLGSILFDDILKGKAKHKYTVYRTDYPLNRICDEHLFGSGSGGEDLSVEFITPFHDQYSMFGEPKCVLHSSEHEGRLLIKLPDSKEMEVELRTYLQTDKFINLKSDATASDTQRKIFNDRSTANRQRKERLQFLLDDLIQRADFFALGSTLAIKAAKSSAAIDEGLDYLVQNVFRKFSYLLLLHDEPLKETKAILMANDLGREQLKLAFITSEPADIKEVRTYIELKIASNHTVQLNELVSHFARRPYGWPEWEVILLVAKIYSGGFVHLKTDVKIEAKDAYGFLSKTSQWKNVQIIKRKTPDPEALKKATALGKDIFGSIGPEGADKLSTFLRQRLTGWQTDLGKHKSLADTQKYPGKREIDDCLACAKSLLAIKDIFEFIKAFNNQKNDLLDAAEDISDLNGFYTSQIKTWEILRQAITDFTHNKSALVKDADAAKALARLEDILIAPSPYGMLHEVNSLIAVVKVVNDKKVQTARDKAIASIDNKIARVGKLLDAASATADLRNKALYGLQGPKKQLQDDVSIPHIVYTTGEVEEIYEAAVDLIENEIAPDPTKRKPKKAIQTIRPANLVAKTYLETEDDVIGFVDSIKKELMDAVKENKRIKIQ